MKDYQRKLIEVAVEQSVLQFGAFTLKSGRISPYFFNAGRFQTAESLALLAENYAHAFSQLTSTIDCIFGPAYKGIPLAALAAKEIYQSLGHNLRFSYNRKEAKNHGEGGVLVGSVSGNILILDDVITAGTALREALALLKAEQANPKAMLIILDRMETGTDGNSAIQQARDAFGLEVQSLISIEDIIAYLSENAETEKVDQLLAYREQYGVSA